MLFSNDTNARDFSGGYALDALLSSKRMICTVMAEMAARGVCLSVSVVNILMCDCLCLRAFLYVCVCVFVSAQL